MGFLLSTSLVVETTGLIEVKQEKINIVVDIGTLSMIVKTVSGDAANVTVILPEGVDPHSYSLTANDIKKIEEADLLVLADPTYFSIDQRILDHADGKPVLYFENYSEHGATYLSFPGFEKNYHAFWLYPINAKAIALAVRDAMILIDASNSQTYESRTSEFVEKVDVMVEEISKISKDEKWSEYTVGLMVPGVAYLAMTMGFNIDAIIIKDPHESLSASEVARLEEKMKNGSIDFLICPQELKLGKPGQQAEQFRADTGIRVLYLQTFAMNFLDDYVAFIMHDVGMTRQFLQGEDVVITTGGSYVLILYGVIAFLMLLILAESYWIFRMRSI